jgi:uncharacterized membrane protein YkvA (DUF1232 family)
MAKQRNPDLLTRFVNDVVLSARLMFDRRVSSTAKLIPVIMLIYLISPLDLIPELAFGPFGLIDDITVMLVGFQLFIHSVPPDVVREYREGKPPSHERPLRSGDEPQIIDGEYIVHDDRLDED